MCKDRLISNSPNVIEEEKLHISPYKINAQGKHLIIVTTTYTHLM